MLALSPPRNSPRKTKSNDCNKKLDLFAGRQFSVEHSELQNFISQSTAGGSCGRT